jgi:hypothetical protein
VRAHDSMNAVYRTQPSLRRKPDLSHLSSPGRHNFYRSLRTRCVGHNRPGTSL